MKKGVTITPTAAKDVQKAIDYYNDQQKDLGKRFAKDAHNTFMKIGEMPNLLLSPMAL